MKFLKWLFIVVLVIVALIFIAALFMPATVEVTADKDVSATPEQVFHNAAMYTDRDKWDPWLEMEPEAEVSISPEPDYIGSEYTWNGKKIKTGKMRVDSVVFGKYIASSIYFGKSPEPSLVEWDLEKTGTGTKITWSFKADANYPFGRVMMSFMKGSMKKSFDKGLSNLSEYLKENPPSLSTLGPIENAVLPPMLALVARESGTMEQFEEQMGRLFGMLMAEIDAQGLQIAGPPFSHYLSWDEETMITEYLCGIPVAEKAKSSGEVKFKAYKEMPVIQAMHTGPYEEFSKSYEILMKHVQENAIETNMQALEFYYTDPETEPSITKWQTLIAMPLK